MSEGRTTTTVPSVAPAFQMTNSCSANTAAPICALLQTNTLVPRRYVSERHASELFQDLKNVTLTAAVTSAVRVRSKVETAAMQILV